MQGRLLASGLTGRARALAPLAQMAGQLGVQRNEDIRRAVQPMLGIDPRTTGEKLQTALANIDTSTPAGLLEAANMVQSIDPVRAATLRQEAARVRTEQEDRAMARKTEELRQLQAGTSIAAATQTMRLQENAEKRAVVAAEYAAQQAGLSQAATVIQINKGARDIIDRQNADADRGDIANALRRLGAEYELYATGIESNSFDAIDVLPRVAAQELAKVKTLALEDYKPLSKTEITEYDALAQEMPELKDVLSKGLFGYKDPIVSSAKFHQLIAVERQAKPTASPDQILQSVATKIKTGIAAPVAELDIEAMAQEQAGKLGFDPEAAAAAAAAGLGSEAPEQDVSVDPEFESTLRNLEATGTSTDQAVTRYVNRTKAEIGSTRTAIKNRKATNSDASDLESRLSVLEARLNRYSQ